MGHNLWRWLYKKMIYLIKTVIFHSYVVYRRVTYCEHACVLAFQARRAKGKQVKQCVQMCYGKYVRTCVHLHLMANVAAFMSCKTAKLKKRNIKKKNNSTKLV